MKAEEDLKKFELAGSLPQHLDVITILGTSEDDLVEIPPSESGQESNSFAQSSSSLYC